MDLRERLDAWRLAHGLTRRGFADLLGVHEALVGKWLHDDPRRRVVPGRDNLQRIAEVTAIPYRELRDLADGVEAEAAAPVAPDTDPGLLHLISVWTHLSDERRESILTLSGKVQPIRRGGKPPKRRFDSTSARYGSKSMTTRVMARQRPIAA